MTTQNYAKPGNERLQPGGTKESNQIQDLIMEALQGNPNPDSEIQKATKLVQNLDEDIFRITEKLKKRQFDERQVNIQLHWLEYDDRYFYRGKWTDNAEKLASLKRDLDKLTFANNAYKEKAIMTEENIINFHDLYFLMHHGTKNMAMEKKLLKEANASQKKLPDHSDSGLSVGKQINDRIWNLRESIRVNRFITEPAIRVDKKRVLKEINELKWARDKAIANAPVNGKTWNSLPSKNVIKQQIELMEKDLIISNEERKEHLQLWARIEEAKARINVVKEDICSLKKELLDVQRKKEEACEAVLKLIKI